MCVYLLANKIHIVTAVTVQNRKLCFRCGYFKSVFEFILLWLWTLDVSTFWNPFVLCRWGWPGSLTLTFPLFLRAGIRSVQWVPMSDFLKIKKTKTIFYVYGCFVWMYVYIPFVCRYLGDQKKVSDSLQLELKLVVSHRVSWNLLCRPSSASWDWRCLPPHRVYAVFLISIPNLLSCLPDSYSSLRHWEFRLTKPGSSPVFFIPSFLWSVSRCAKSRCPSQKQSLPEHLLWSQSLFSLLAWQVP